LISARIVADSICANRKRLTTLSLVYPRFIHSELMTHRKLSRNAASSRAIPVKRMLEDVLNDPAMPIFFGKNQKGMSASEELEPELKKQAIATILLLRDTSVKMVEALNDLGLHKQTANRYLEPWQHMNTIVTATEWDNFKNLRISPKAQPEFMALASAIRDAMEAGDPHFKGPGDWHLPYVQNEEFNKYSRTDPHRLLKLSVARCARVSYKTHEGEVDEDKDMIRYNDLLLSGHMSPFEHQARPFEEADYASGNFSGWQQYRKLIPFEDVFRDDPSAVDIRKQFAETTTLPS
jgi:thymidylate synthase ThyX